MHYKPKKKTWRKYVGEDLTAALGAEEEATHGRGTWRSVIKHHNENEKTDIY